MVTYDSIGKYEKLFISGCNREVQSVSLSYPRYETHLSMLYHVVNVSYYIDDGV